MIRLVIFFVLAVTVSACSTQPAIVIITPTPLPATLAPTSTVNSTPIIAPTVTPIPQPTEPTLIPTAIFFQPAAVPVVLPDAVGAFAEIVANHAMGEPAPDFSARILNGEAFRLSEQRGSFTLLFSTVVGCGECVATTRNMAAAYNDYLESDMNLKVVVLDLYTDDPPEVWQGFAELYADVKFDWGVVDSPQFVIDYGVTNLGTILLVDPEGKLVYQGGFLQADDFRQMFDLISQ